MKDHKEDFKTNFGFLKAFIGDIPNHIDFNVVFSGVNVVHNGVNLDQNNSIVDYINSTEDYIKVDVVWNIANEGLEKSKISFKIFLMILHNKLSKEELKKKLREEDFKRITLSFYHYVIIDNPNELRDALYKQWNELNVLGRIYLANEGINAQLSVPEANFDAFKKYLYSLELFKNVPFKIAVEDDGKSFYKLIVRVKNKIVAAGDRPNV